VNPPTTVFRDLNLELMLRGPECPPLLFGQVGVFQMGEAGLQAVINPSAVFLQDREAAPNVSAAVTVMVEGTRPLLLEVQALCSRVNYVRTPFRGCPVGHFSRTCFQVVP
jgi:hypothetical protein